jgi:hypothetical protein
MYVIRRMANEGDKRWFFNVWKCRTKRQFENYTLINQATNGDTRTLLNSRYVKIKAERTLD